MLTRPAAVVRRVLAEPLEPRRLLATVPAGFVDAGFGGTIGSGTAMTFAPDGRLFVLGQTGTVRVIQPSGAASTALTLAVNSSGERGLLGIAFDPDFASNSHVYLYHTVPAAGTVAVHNEVSRFTVTGNTINASSRTNVLTLDPLTSATNHNGGAIHFGPDGKLYVAVGDNATSANSQSSSTRHGKMLRINKDGTIPSDNPTSIAGLGAIPNNQNRAIWAAGLRNPFTFNFDPGVPGRVYINDVGQNTWEEVNVGLAGRNFGWPGTEGDFNQASFPNFTRPLYSYAHAPNNNQQGYSIAGGAFYRGGSAATQFPAQFQGKYFFADYVNNWINYLDPASPPTSPSSATVFATGANGTVDVQMGPDGALYYLQRGTTAGVRRIAVNPSLAPSIVEQPEDQAAPVGGSATFTVNAVGNSGTLQYQWQRNGTNITGATAASYTRTNLTSADDGAQFRVVVSNNAGTVISNAATLDVTASNTLPVPTIGAPASGALYVAGQPVNFSGGATDAEDGALGGDALSWEIVFHHDTHTHPFLSGLSGSSGTFTPATLGETSANVWYRVILTATDSAGGTATTFRDVFPRTSTITLEAAGFTGLGTVNANPVMKLDGQPQPSGTSVLSVEGVQRELEAPTPQTFGGQTYEFVSWGNGTTNPVRTVSTPTDDTTYVATFRDATRPALATGVFTRERAAPGSPPHEVVFTFSEGVAASASALTLVNQTTGQTVPAANVALLSEPNQKRLRFRFPGYADGVLQDGNYSATLAGSAVADGAGNTVLGAPVVDFRVLAGDANDDGTVNFTDLAALAANYGQGGRSFAQGNFDYDASGTVTFADLSILSVRYGTSLPAPRPAPLASGTTTRVAADVFADGRDVI